MSESADKSSAMRAQVQQIVDEIRTDQWVDPLLRGDVTKMRPIVGDDAIPSALNQLGGLDPRLAQMVKPMSEPITALSHDHDRISVVLSGPLRGIRDFLSVKEKDLGDSQRKLAGLWQGGAAAATLQQYATGLRLQLDAGSVATGALAIAVDHGGLVLAAAKHIALGVAQAAALAALSWIRTQAIGLLSQGVEGISKIIQHIAGDMQRATAKIARIATAGVTSIAALKALIERMRQAIRGGGSSGGGPPKPDKGALAQRAKEMLTKLPDTALAGLHPMPVLGSEGGPAVQRDGKGIITNVLVDGRWLGQADYVSYLMKERVAQLNEAVADPNSGISKRKTKPCVSVAVDWRTGQTAEGNNNLTIVQDDLHPLLKDRLDDFKAHHQAAGILYGDSLYPHESNPGTHAEIYAVNRLLWEREAAGVPVNAATPGELRIDNFFPWTKGGQPAPCCANCTGLLTGIPCNAGKLLDSPRTRQIQRWETPP